MALVYIAVVGIIFGSFINALVWRVHQQESPKSKRKASDAELSIMKGRSMCVHCGHTLSLKDLVPVLSWVSLRGKCRYCSKRISWQYPLVEITTAVLFVISYLHWPNELAGFEWFYFVLWLGYLVALVALFVYDLRWYLLPNRIVYPLIVAAMLQTVVMAIELSDAAPVRDAVLGLLIGGGIFYVLFQVSGGRWIGGGDVKLGFFLGILLGPVGSFMLLFLASVIGSVVAVTLMAAKVITRKSILPFGPFLIAAGFVVMLFGERIADWYETTFLLTQF